MPEENLFITKIKSDAGEDFIIVTNWQEDVEEKQVEILSLNFQNSCYKGIFTNQALTETAENLEIVAKVFCEDIKKALKYSSAEDQKDFIYSLSEGTFEILKNETIGGVVAETIYLSINNLEEIPRNQLTISAMTQLLNENCDLKSELQRKTVPIHEIKKDQELFMTIIEKLTKEKNEIESNFCTKIAAFVNSKKQKIKELKCRISELERNIPSTSKTVPKFNENRFAVELPSSSSLDLIDDFIDSLELSGKITDEEMNETRGQIKELKKNISELEKNAINNSSSSLDLDLDETVKSLDLSRTILEVKEPKTPEKRIAEKRKFTPDKALLQQIVQSPSSRRSITPKTKRQKSQRIEPTCDSDPDIFNLENIEEVEEPKTNELEEIPSSQPEASQSIFSSRSMRRTASYRLRTPTSGTRKSQRIVYDAQTEDMLEGLDVFNDTSFPRKNRD